MDVLYGILILLGCVGIVAVPSVLVLGILTLSNKWCLYYNNLQGADVLLTFKQFKNYYELNPSAYKLTAPEDTYGSNYICRDRVINIGFTSFWSFLLFLRWHSKMREEKAQQARMKHYAEFTQEFIKRVEGDINHIKKQAEQEQELAIELVKRSTLQ